jgi:hypothetical protein
MPMQVVPERHQEAAMSRAELYTSDGRTILDCFSRDTVFTTSVTTIRT